MTFIKSFVVLDAFHLCSKTSRLFFENLLVLALFCLNTPVGFCRYSSSDLSIGLLHL